MFLSRLQHSAVLLALLVGAATFAYAGFAGLQVPITKPAHSQAQDPVRKPAEADPSRQGRIYFLNNANLASIQPDGQKLVQLPRNFVNEGYFQPHSTRLSPDRRTLAFGLGEFRDNTMHPPSKIRLLDVTQRRGSDVLVDMPGLWINEWVWSPDGTKLAFTAGGDEQGGYWRNWIVDVKTKALTEIRFPKVKWRDGDKEKELQPGIADWSQDGQWFLASCGGLYLAKRDGSVWRRVLPRVVGSASFSPDGRKVLFVETREDRSCASFVMDVAGGPARAVVDAKNFAELQACWSPDGLRIAYKVTPLDPDGQRGEETSLFVVDVDGKNTVSLLTEKHGRDEVRLTLLDWR